VPGSRPCKIVIAGALGLVGRAALAHFEQQDDWEVLALSRRRPNFPTRASYLSVDLSDRSSCKALAAERGVTHVVYAALYHRTADKSGWIEAENIAGNRAMLSNLLDALEPGNPSLRHVSILQGTKAYGSHLGSMTVPGKESSPRHPHPNFYWAQEDLLRERQPKSSWSWTIFRPQIVLGYALGSPLNLIAALGVYAAVSRELGLPLVFPGRGEWVTEATDSRLLARAFDWAGDTPAARNQVFNVTNGDAMLFRNLWPAVARTFGMEVGIAQPTPLAVVMADKEPVWQRIVARHGLKPHSLEELVGGSWAFVDDLFSRAWPASLLSTIKIRQAGFADCIDTEASIVGWLKSLQAEKVLPP